MVEGGFLRGWKTYIFAGLLALGGLAQWAVGDAALPDVLKGWFSPGGLVEVLLGGALAAKRMAIAGVEKKLDQLLASQTAPVADVLKPFDPFGDDDA